jgi:quinol monooxygenase YgiN
VDEKVAKICEVFVFWRLVAKPEHVEEVRAAYNRSLSPELREAGCTRYECYQDLKHNDALLALCVWQSKSQFEKHLAAVHDNLAAVNRLLLAPPETYVLQNTSPSD